jgi:hypothetical protein
VTADQGEMCQFELNLSAQELRKGRFPEVIAGAPPVIKVKGGTCRVEVVLERLRNRFEPTA